MYDYEPMLPSNFDFTKSFFICRTFSVSLLLMFILPSCLYSKKQSTFQHELVMRIYVYWTISEILMSVTGFKNNCFVYSLAYVHCCSCILRDISQKNSRILIKQTLIVLCYFLNIIVPIMSCILFNSKLEINAFYSLLLFTGEIVGLVTDVVMFVNSALGSSYEKMITTSYFRS